jgi:hypothetical protein
MGIGGSDAQVLRNGILGMWLRWHYPTNSCLPIIWFLKLKRESQRTIILMVLYSAKNPCGLGGMDLPCKVRIWLWFARRPRRL